jgi:carbamoyl-phosphate synthase large subunit
MTDPELADKTYIEPITTEIIAKIIAKEHPDALLPTLGGQTALNAAINLAEKGILKKYKVEVIGANIKAIKRGEDRHLFKETMERIGLDLPESDKAYNLKQACEIAAKIGFPLIIRPSFTLGGTGGSVAYNIEEFKGLAKRGLESSMISEILIEESVLGWKEFELEVMRDRKDNVVIICSIENLDPMGIHTGDSITVAPIQTLTDKEYQRMRDAAIACIRAIGVETGGSNIQFAVHPETGRMVVIEMNPRVSRSSALASKATGFPIAKIAAKLAVGYTLDEIPNDITKETPACFEPAIDYCVVKIPRFTFEKFPSADPALTVSMKSVGEVMAIGRTFKEALQKGLRSLEIKKYGLESILSLDPVNTKTEHDIIEKIYQKLRVSNAERIFYLGDAFRAGIDLEKVYDLTKIDRWFLHNIKEIIDLEKHIIRHKDNITDKDLITAKQFGFSDRQLARLLNKKEEEILQRRIAINLQPDFKLVDTCAAEFKAFTPYYYSSYDK